MKRYTHWKAKAGTDYGVVMKGTRKSGQSKKTFAKKISIERSATVSLNEYLTLIAAKTCGVITPKLKLKPVGQKFYQFSRDLTEPAFNDKQETCFVPLFKFNSAKCKYQYNANHTAVTRRGFLNQPDEHIAIDKHSLAKLAMAALVFDYRDLHDENVGLVIDHNTKTARFALVDLVMIPQLLDLKILRNCTTFSNFFQEDKTNGQIFIALPVDMLQEEDYVRALTEIAAEMKNACAAVAAQTNMHCINDIIDKNHVPRMITTWERNLEVLNLFALNPLLVPRV